MERHPGFMDRKTSVIKTAILPKAIYRLSAFLIKIWKAYLQKWKKIDSKIHMQLQRVSNSQNGLISRIYKEPLQFSKTNKSIKKWVKEFYGHFFQSFAKDYQQIPNKHTQRRLTSLVIGEMWIKITVRYTSRLRESPELKEKGKQVLARMRLLVLCYWNTQWCSHYGKQLCRSSKSRTELPYDPVVTLLPEQLKTEI